MRFRKALDSTFRLANSMAFFIRLLEASSWEPGH